MKLRRLIIISLFLLFITGCKKDFEINAKWESIPVVYCILNPTDTIHYLRLSRTFQASPDYLQSAMNSDSIHFNPEDVIVSIHKIENGSPVGDAIIFESTNEVLKDSGLFTNENYTLFKTAATINENTEYKLTIDFIKLNTSASSIIKTINQVTVIEPNTITHRKIDFTYLNNFSVQWIPQSSAKIYQVLVAFNYCEIMPNHDSINKVLLWQSRNVIAGFQEANLSLEIPGDPGFYNFLKNNISVNHDVKRRAIALDFTVLAGGSELSDYYLSASLNANDIALLNIYSNIENGKGIFSSCIDTRVNNKLLSENTLDSISRGHITRELNFADHYGVFH